MSQPANQFHIPTPPTRSDLETWDTYLTTWRTYWRALGQVWRTEPEIDAKRQDELARRRTIVPDIKQGIYPFKDIKLSRADIEWLLATHENGRGPVDWNDESQHEREGLDLRGADLSRVNLQNLPLTGLRGGLNTNDRRDVTATERDMAAINLEQANLSKAQLQRVNLRRAHLRGADLTWAQLQNADLRGAQLQRVNLSNADLSGTYLQRTELENTTLDGVILSDTPYGAAFLADVRWGDANLAVVDWRHVKKLGDEYLARQWIGSQGQVKEKRVRLSEYRAAVRANRQLATMLRDQGLNEDADRFAYRAQVLQRKVLGLQGNVLMYAFSLLLDILAGYGYRPGRFIFSYLLVIVAFAAVYYGFTQVTMHPLSLDGALIFSITSFHGRGFFPSGFSYNDPVTIVAALEAFIGLILEISFIATFTRRFFSR
jgi:uncharacterized protein YjbI with pentapeptide repeats